MSKQVEKYRYYDGMNVKNFEHLSRISTYNNNYYCGSGKDLLFAKSDDDMTTYWFVVRGDDTPFYIGYSILNPGKPERLQFDTEFPS